MTREPPLQILLVEDNPGDARYLEEILRDATELLERTIDRGSEGSSGESVEATDETPELTHETRLEAGIERLDDERPDVVLLDLDLPDSTGIDTLRTTLEHAETVPVVVLTGLRDSELGMEALRLGAEEYLVKDEINPDLLTRTVYHAIERKAHERELEQQRERLEALNKLNEIVQEITDAVIDQSTREEIEQTVCEQLAGSDSYEFAWIGEVDSTTETVKLRTEAGVEGYLDDTTVSVDPEDPRSHGPGGKAIRTGEVQVVSDVQEDPEFEPWRDTAEEYGYQSAAGIPIVHDDTVYGLLGVYAARPNAFEGEERDVIAQLGEIVGHAIAAVERKRALMSDEVREVDFRIPDVFGDLDAPPVTGDRITLDEVVPIGGDEFLVYGTATEDGASTVEALVDAVPHWEAVRTVGEGSDRETFELRLSEPPVLTVVASHGGYVTEAYIEDGDYHVTAQLPHSVEVRQFAESVQEAYPSAEFRAQRQVTRNDEGFEQTASAYEEALTDRQRAILESAYFAGYFEWPRTSSGEEIAESLDIAPATFSQHLRSAENRIFGALFGDQT